MPVIGRPRIESLTRCVAPAWRAAARDSGHYPCRSITVQIRLAFAFAVSALCPWRPAIDQACGQDAPGALAFDGVAYDCQHWSGFIQVAVRGTESVPCLAVHAPPLDSTSDISRVARVAWRRHVG